MTLIELLVTIAILAILIGIAIPSMTRFIAQWQVSNAVNALTGSLRLARTEAIARSRPVVLCPLDSSAPNNIKCLSTMGSTGLASGWIVFVNNDLDANSNYSSSGSDEILLLQKAFPGIANMTPTGNTGSFTFYPSGLSTTAAGFNVDAKSFDRTSTTPWARKGICITKPGRIRYVTDSVDCSNG